MEVSGAAAAHNLGESIMALVKVRVHYEYEFDVEVAEDQDVYEAIADAADRHMSNVERKDLEWLGTYAEDENGEEIYSIS